MMSKNYRDLTLFMGMSDKEIVSCLSELKAKEKQYKKDQTIFHAGSTTSVMGVVLSGSVTIESNDMWGNRTILSLIGKNEFFAETYALLKDEVMLVDAVANEDSLILLLNLDAVRSEKVSWASKLISNLLTISARKNLHLSGRGFHTAPKSIRGRVLSYLNSVSLQKQKTSFDIPFDRQQLADYLNVERTALSKELGKMQKDGLIKYHKNNFVILSS